MDIEEAQKLWLEKKAEDHSNIKVKAGQIWGNGFGGHYQIIRVSGGIAFRQYGDNESSSFGILDSSGCPNWTCGKEGTGGWRMIGYADNAPIQKRAAGGLKPMPTLADFFRSVPQGNCPCNIPRAACEYHR